MKYSSYTLIFFLFTICSCAENKEEFVPDESYGDVKTLFNTITQKPEVSIFNSDEDFYFTSFDKSIVIFIPAGSLIHSNGKVVSGNVELRLLNIYNSGGMILNSLNSKTSDGILEIQKTFSLEILQGTEKLLAKQTNDIDVIVKAENFNQYNSLFSFKKGEWSDLLTSEGSQGRLNYGNWELNTNSGIILAKGYKAELSSLGWIAIGINEKLSNSTSYCAELPQHFNEKNTMAYILLRNKMYVIEMNDILENLYCVQQDGISNNAEIVTISDKAQKLLIGTGPLIKNGKATIIPIEKTKTQIVEFLGSN
jgi:hypothetical protein